MLNYDDDEFILAFFGFFLQLTLLLQLNLKPKVFELKLTVLKV